MKFDSDKSIWEQSKIKICIRISSDLIVNSVESETAFSKSSYIRIRNLSVWVVHR